MKLAFILCLSVALATFSLASAVKKSHHDVVEKSHKSSHKSDGEDEHKNDGKKYSDNSHEDKADNSKGSDEDESHKGENFEENHKVEDKERGGKKGGYHDKGHHKSHKNTYGGSSHGLQFIDGAKHKKKNYKQGFREKYHRDEHKKHDSFYSDRHKDGEYRLFGKQHAKHSEQASAQKSLGKHKYGKSENNYSKDSKKAGGHSDAENKGYHNDKATSDHYDTTDSYGKKGATAGGKHFQYNHGK